MAGFIISPYAISFNSIRNCLQKYIQNKSDVTTKWTDFYTAGAGETILELDAAVAAFYMFHFIIGRRESFLTVAQNYNSVVGGAMGLGYCASRGHNLYLKATITPTVTMTLPKWTIIGSYADYDVILTENTILNANKATEIKFVIGNSYTQSIEISSANLQQFTFTDPNVTDDIRLLLQRNTGEPFEVPYTTELKEAIDDKYITLTNPYGAVDVFYLNTGNYSYTNNDVLYLQFIQRNSLKYADFSASQLALDFADQVEDIKIIEDRLDPEPKDHIRKAAPIYHETNNVVRARKDYVKHLLQNNPNLVDANDQDINPGLIALTYLKRQDIAGITALMTEKEKEDYIASISAICPGGVATAIIEDPVRVVRNLTIAIKPLEDEFISPTLGEEIDEILSVYKNKLCPSIDLHDIEHAIEKIQGVKTARVEFTSYDYAPNTKYKLYDIVHVPGIKVEDGYETWSFFCYKVNATTSNEAPDWVSAPSYGDQLVDHNFIWQNSNKRAQSISAKWRPNGTYELYSDINMSYKIQPSCTAAMEPVWGKSTQNDGNVTWNKLKTYTIELPTYKDDFYYRVGDKVIVQSGDLKGIYTCTKVTYNSSKTEPNWAIAQEDSDLVRDNAITWRLKYFGWEPGKRYAEGDVIGILLNNKIYTYSALNNGTSGTSKIIFNGDETVYDTGYIESTGTESTIEWKLRGIQDLYKPWKEFSTFEKNDLTIGNNNIFECTGVYNANSGTGTVFYDTLKWLTTVEDNNITWEIDLYSEEDSKSYCCGKSWLSAKEYETDDLIIVTSNGVTYIYEAIYVITTETEIENVIYSIVCYAGRTGEHEPIWQGENVIDNEILWTKTENIPSKTWEPNKVYYFGDIIETDEGNYTFSSILGTSGETSPNWAGVTNGVVTDNNIVWMRIGEATEYVLQWNEYLDLHYTYEIIK